MPKDASGIGVSIAVLNIRKEKGMKKSLNRTGIEYGDWAWNFLPGCLHKQQGVCAGDNCWARAMAARQGFDFNIPRLKPEFLTAPLGKRKRSVVLVNFMGDLFGDWVNPDEKVLEYLPSGVGMIEMSLKAWVFTTIRERPQDRFLFLTKAWRNIAAWGKFPENCWVGATITDGKKLYDAIYSLADVDCSHRWLSVEPMLGPVDFCEYVPVGTIGGVETESRPSWIVLGCESGPKRRPCLHSWMIDIVRQCRAAGMPLWIKQIDVNARVSHRPKEWPVELRARQKEI